MKAFIALTLLTLTTGAYAETICFVPVERATSIPHEICFEKVAADTHKEILFIKDTQGFFPSELNADYFARRNENGYRFKVSQVITDIWENGCGSGEKVTLKIHAQTDNDGIAEISYMDVSAVLEITNDTCHSRTRSYEIKYKLKG